MSSPRVAQRREARVDEILDAATALVVRDGLEALTLQRLAGELGLTTTALYRYFPGKTELMTALQVRAIASFSRELDGQLSRVKAPLAQVLAAAAALLDEPRVAPARHLLIDAFLSSPRPQLDEGALAEVEAVLGPLLSRVAGAFAAAEEAGHLAPGDPALRTRALWAALHGVHHLRRRDRVEPPSRGADALADELVATLLAGWGADKRALAAARRERGGARRARR